MVLSACFGSPIPSPIPQACAICEQPLRAGECRQLCCGHCFHKVRLLASAAGVGGECTAKFGQGDLIAHLEGRHLNRPARVHA